MRGATATPGSTPGSAAAGAPRIPAATASAVRLKALTFRPEALFRMVHERDLRSRLRRGFHMVRPPEPLFGEVDFERIGERMSVPSIAAQYLLIVRAGFIPLRQQA